jgi:hypothetical protein
MSRIQKLIDILEAGQDLTPEILRRTAQLQALDFARAGELFMEEAQQREVAADEQWEQHIKQHTPGR